MSKKRVAVYLRVSTQEQNTDLQRSEVVAYADAKGWEVVDVFEDKATGTNANRQALQALLSKVRASHYDIVICWKLDRLFRSLKDVILTLQEFTDLNVEFVAIKDNVDLTTSAGRLLTHILGAFGEFEASIIRSRVKAGLAEAKRKGVQLGRKKSRPSELIRELRSKGYTYREIARLAKCSSSTVSRELNSKEFQNDK